MLIPFDFPEISSPESVPSPAHTTVDEMTRSHSEWASRGFSRRCPVPIKPTTQSISQLPPVQSNQSLSTVDETADVVEIEK
ncbi:hypothetical protein YC2023_052280 [Brassica napus]